MLIRWSTGQLDTIIDDSMILLKFKSANLQEKKNLYQKQNQKKGTEQSPPEREGDSFLGRLGEMGEMRWSSKIYLRQCTNLIFCKRGRSKETEVSRLQLSSSKTCNKYELSF